MFNCKMERQTLRARKRVRGWKIKHKHSKWFVLLLYADIRNRVKGEEINVLDISDTCNNF